MKLVLKSEIKEPMNVAIVLWPGVELLDFAGPGEVFAAARHAIGTSAFRVFTVGATSDPIVSQGFVKITPEFTIKDCPKPAIVVLPGGGTRNAVGDDELVEWVARVAKDAEVMLSVCTGAFILHRAGLLDGKEATTYHGAIEDLRRVATKTKVHDNMRFVDNGRVITSAGVSAGIDSSLHVVSRILGLEQAKATARYMEYHWDPQRTPGYVVGQSQNP